MPEIKKPFWIIDLVKKTNALAKDFQLDDLQTEIFRDFIVSQAKSNYVAGNNAGIYWARHGKSKAAELLQTLIND